MAHESHIPTSQTCKCIKDYMQASGECLQATKAKLKTGAKLLDDTC